MKTTKAWCPITLDDLYYLIDKSDYQKIINYAQQIIDNYDLEEYEVVPLEWEPTQE